MFAIQSPLTISSIPPAPPPPVPFSLSESSLLSSCLVRHNRFPIMPQNIADNLHARGSLRHAAHTTAGGRTIRLFWRRKIIQKFECGILLQKTVYLNVSLVYIFNYFKSRKFCGVFFLTLQNSNFECSIELVNPQVEKLKN